MRFGEHYFRPGEAAWPESALALQKADQAFELIEGLKAKLHRTALTAAADPHGDAEMPGQVTFQGDRIAITPGCV